MNSRSQIRLRRNLKAGFTLLEALVAMVVGLVVVGAGFMLFQSASSTSRSTMSRAEMQQNGRAALNFMMQDLSMASTDYQQSGIALATVGTTKPVFECAGCAISTYPNNLATAIVPYENNSMNGTSDTITVIYVDNSWPPTAQNIVTKATPNPPCPCATISASGDQVTVSTASFLDSNSVPRTYQDGQYGSKVGDVMMIWNSTGHVLATVTNVAGGGVLSLADGDALNLNQSTALTANVASLKGAAAFYPEQTATSRVKIVTYFVQNTPGPDGVLGTPDDIPVLMRQVNGDVTPTEVVDYVQNLQLTYDIYDASNHIWQFASTGIGGAAPTVSNPTQIQKINIALQMRSQYKNSSGNYDTFWVSSSVSPRNMSFTDRYN